jgi:hypothetical protein
VCGVAGGCSELVRGCCTCGGARTRLEGRRRAARHRCTPARSLRPAARRAAVPSSAVIKSATISSRENGLVTKKQPGRTHTSEGRGAGLGSTGMPLGGRASAKKDPGRAGGGPCSWGMQRSGKGGWKPKRLSHGATKPILTAAGGSASGVAAPDAGRRPRPAGQRRASCAAAPAAGARARCAPAVQARQPARQEQFGFQQLPGHAAGARGMLGPSVGEKGSGGGARPGGARLPARRRRGRRSARTVGPARRSSPACRGAPRPC